MFFLTRASCQTNHFALPFWFILPENLSRVIALHKDCANRIRVLRSGGLTSPHDLFCTTFSTPVLKTSSSRNISSGLRRNSCSILRRQVFPALLCVLCASSLDLCVKYS